MKKSKFRIGQMKTTSNQNQSPSCKERLIAAQAKKAMDDFTPLVTADRRIDPVQALVLIAMQMHGNIAGKDESITEEKVKWYCAHILAAWGSRLFIPDKLYPYTFIETVNAFRGSGNVEDEAGR